MVFGVQSAPGQGSALQCEEGCGGKLLFDEDISVHDDMPVMLPPGIVDFLLSVFVVGSHITFRAPVQFIIRTDPKNRDYEFVEGIRKKVCLRKCKAGRCRADCHAVAIVLRGWKQEESYTSADNETIDISDEKRDEIRSHAIMQLEKTQDDKRKARVNKER